MTAPLTTLSAQRCRNHPHREAAANCTTCRRPFCRECVADHHGRMVCADCLARALASAKPRLPTSGRLRRALRQGTATAVALLVAWLYFYALGRLLHALPETMQEFAKNTEEP